MPWKKPGGEPKEEPLDVVPMVETNVDALVGYVGDLLIRKELDVSLIEVYPGTIIATHSERHIQGMEPDIQDGLRLLIEKRWSA